MTYYDAVKEIADFAGQGLGGAFETQVRRLVNQKYLGLLDLTEIPHEQRMFTLTTVAATAEYGLPLYVKDVLNVEDPTNDRFIYMANRRFFDRGYPGTSESSTPTFAFPLGVRGVEKYPASDGTLSLVSSAAGDTGVNYKVRVTGFNASGVLVTELVTITGATSVVTTNSYDSTLGVERVVKSPASGFTFSGNITVSDDDGNTIAVVPSWWDSPDYVWIRFHPIPDAAITYNVRAEMRKPPLVNDTDWPEFDANYHMLLVFGVTMDLLGGLGKAAVANQHRASYKELEARFKSSCGKVQGEVFTFGAVGMFAGTRNRPLRPLIKGVDFGLATES